MKELEVRSAAGIPFLIGLIVAVILEIALIVVGGRGGGPLFVISGVMALMVTLVCLAGFYMVEPNQSAVLTLFGRYVGTVREQGLRWNNPFYSERKVSLRVRNFESGRLKVNEAEGSPIEIAAVVVWKVVDSAEAVFNVDDYESYVHVQSEAALRQMASSYPYDQHEEGQVSLRSHAAEISQHLKEQLEERLAKAGIDVLEARISHLAYAPEIAQAMLQRQQANAVIAARTRIVEGAVGMVEMALEKLKAKGVVDLDEERRAQMVSNLLVVLCADRAATPVVNTGSLY
ncbi:MAG: SPFH domain-containing protein [Xanthomonadales bacterium]|nr:SPFH domain-containing protein [Xanthomonadales bacterium]